MIQTGRVYKLYISYPLFLSQETIIPVPEKNYLKLKNGASAADVANWCQAMRFFQWNKAHFDPYSRDLLHFTDESTVHTIDSRERVIT